MSQKDDSLPKLLNCEFANLAKKSTHNIGKYTKKVRDGTTSFPTRTFLCVNFRTMSRGVAGGL